VLIDSLSLGKKVEKKARKKGFGNSKTTGETTLFVVYPGFLGKRNFTSAAKKGRTAPPHGGLEKGERGGRSTIGEHEKGLNDMGPGKAGVSWDLEKKKNFDSETSDATYQGRSRAFHHLDKKRERGQ